MKKDKKLPKTWIFLFIAYTVLIAAAFVILQLKYIIIFLVWAYSVVFLFGLIYFLKFSFWEKKVNTGLFLTSQVFILLGVLVLMFFSSIFVKEVKPFLEAKSYFEIGSYSFAVSSIILVLNKNDRDKPEVRKAGLLTLVSTFIFFVIGLILSSFEIFSTQYSWFAIFQNTGFILASFDLTYSVSLLMDYYLKTRLR